MKLTTEPGACEKKPEFAARTTGVLRAAFAQSRRIVRARRARVRKLARLLLQRGQLSATEIASVR